MAIGSRANPNELSKLVIVLVVVLLIDLPLVSMTIGSRTNPNELSKFARATKLPRSLSLSLLVITHILGKDLRESQRDSATKPRVARNELP